MSKLELELNAQEQEKHSAQKALGDLMMQLEAALGAEASAAGKASQLVQVLISSHFILSLIFNFNDQELTGFMTEVHTHTRTIAIL